MPLHSASDSDVMDGPSGEGASAELPDPRADALADRAFGRHFWITYAANSCMMVAVSLLYRYADFVSYLGGKEGVLGGIVGAGMVGSLLVRLAQGKGIDTYGPRQIWLWSSALFVASCLAHLTVQSADGALIYALRILMQTALAGFYGASITYISGRAPVGRMAEVIGTLGTSGFVGMIVGSKLGDWVFGTQKVTRVQVDRMFLLAACMGCISIVLAWFATRGQLPPQRRRRVPMFRILHRYHPGMILLVAVAMGFGLGLPATFVTAYAREVNIPKIAVFFGVYPFVGFVTRLAIARLPERLGIRPMILAGLANLVLGMLLFLTVRSEYQFVFPALFMGIAHACLFPSVVAGGSGAFPIRYRGLGTTLVLAMFDLGNLVGAPAVGTFLEVARKSKLSAYPTMFVGVAIILGLVAGAYALASRSLEADVAGERRAMAP